jgi:hypothetical protein
VPAGNFPPSINYAVRPTQQRPDGYANAHRKSSGWGAVLVIACLAIGLLAAAVQMLREQLRTEEYRANEMNTSAVFVESQAENLGKFMADPHTVLVGMSGSSGSAVHSASLAWNPAQNSGVLFCDELPIFDASRQYEIWSTGDAGSASRLAEIRAKPGTSVYPFKAIPTSGDVSRFEITAGPRVPGQAPILAGSLAPKSAIGG